jgi:glycosyltransferase involved in cell wall biosynthesis
MQEASVKLLFLRGQVPGDRPKEQIMFDRLEDNCDMWTHLAAELIHDNDYGEIWYEKGNRRVKYRENFVERWVERYASTKPTFTPTLLFARGGFKMYDAVANALEGKAVRVYYGAGGRAVPASERPYDIYLVDTEMQLKKAVARGLKAFLWAKPAAENIFSPVVRSGECPYDIIHVGNYNVNANKGHDFLFKRTPKLKVKVLSVGAVPLNVRKRYPHVDFRGWQPRKRLPGLYALAKVAMVCCPGKDSCPRVVPEALACDTPILLHDDTRVWRDKYLTSETGLSTRKSTFEQDLHHILKDWETYTPRAYYERELSLKQAAAFIREKVELTPCVSKKQEQH